jgi:hypothetical protein
MNFGDQAEGSTTARRCLDLIERHAPRMMRLGGGAMGVRKELPPARRLTDADRARIVSAAALGGSMNSVVRATGWSWATVVRVLRLAGVVRRDCRAGRKSPRKIAPPRAELIAA